MNSLNLERQKKGRLFRYILKRILNHLIQNWQIYLMYPDLRCLNGKKENFLLMKLGKENRV